MFDDESIPTYTDDALIVRPASEPNGMGEFVYAPPISVKCFLEVKASIRRSQTSNQLEDYSGSMRFTSLYDVRKSDIVRYGKVDTNGIYEYNFTVAEIELKGGLFGGPKRKVAHLKWLV